MSYKVQRPFPSALGAPAVAAGDALPGPARGVPVGCPDPLPGLPWPHAGEPAGPSPGITSAGPAAGGPGVSPHPDAGIEVLGARLDSRILPRFGVSLGQHSPSCCNTHPHPTTSQLSEGGRGCCPRDTLDPPGWGAAGRLPPHGASCSRRWPWAAGAKAQMPPHRLPRRCHLRARGCQAGGATTPPGHPTPPRGTAAWQDGVPPKTGSSGGMRGEGSGTLQGGRKWGRLGCLPAFLPL